MTRSDSESNLWPVPLCGMHTVLNEGKTGLQVGTNDVTGMVSPGIRVSVAVPLPLVALAPACA